MKDFKHKVSGYLKRFQFTQGMAFGLTVSSFLAYGVVNITSFSSGTIISSADVNENFQELKAAVEQLQVKKIGSLSAPYNINCVSNPTWPYTPSYPADFVNVQFDVEDGSTGQTGPNMATITIPEDGVYQIMYYLPDVVSFPIYKYINVNGTPVIVSTPDGAILKKFTSSDTVEVQAACSEVNGTDVDLPQDAMIVIKKL